MPESLRTASRNLLRYLSALLASSRSACRSLLARLRPTLAALRSAARSLVERLPGWLASLRCDCAKLLHRLADGIAPGAPAPEGRADDGEQHFAEMLAELGAQPAPPGQAADSTIKDSTIRALSENLHGLRDLGDQLARTEQERLALAARVQELEAGLGGDTPAQHGVVARLERTLGQREAVLARTRERLSWQRAKTDDWKRKAAERWHEIGSLRKQVKELERAPGGADVAAPAGPLPKRPASGTRPKSRAGRRNARAN